ncbi:hypothetical protein MF406_00380 [Georgenia sp. TF02-10]|uniref:hypothetical protein n=1 Tax=Georgenia sp. TF02-10 TaxID=2917725 RepID=UPI001FA75A93|nr:hypothetical protein [Georgenia sp. TF02-10]UNX54799.1 hypothetical protein MF406_00380 [Georgenia sp. TF02-10]
MKDHSESKIFGGVVMTLLFLAALCAACLPLLAGLVVAAYVPGTGDLRTETGGSRLLHLLRMYPAVFLFATVLGGVRKYLERAGPRRWVAAGEELAMWLFVSALFTVFFEQAAGALLGAAIALLLYWPFVRFLERGAEKNGPDPEEPVASS